MITRIIVEDEDDLLSKELQEEEKQENIDNRIIESLLLITS